MTRPRTGRRPRIITTEQLIQLYACGEVVEQLHDAFGPEIPVTLPVWEAGVLANSIQHIWVLNCMLPHHVLGTVARRVALAQERELSKLYNATAKMALHDPRRRTLTDRARLALTRPVFTALVRYGVRRSV